MKEKCKWKKFSNQREATLYYNRGSQEPSILTRFIVVKELRLKMFCHRSASYKTVFSKENTEDFRKLWWLHDIIMLYLLFFCHHLSWHNRRLKKNFHQSSLSRKRHYYSTVGRICLKSAGIKLIQKWLILCFKTVYLVFLFLIYSQLKYPVLKLKVK